ncbi:hypothetical protein EW093_02205 [Thiospirochaeta perfilievii]|uniref:GyrI-like small molecule binding domain-containing protein n=1 Tax=Thiospirochaeta perfilievii TaxID=252967 RepID=A0A5C1Q929_9SPIO|nr:hypothetical protein [Thiospirochaeta perfilievii]QEN03560.1 hypothetical protein EW093_02205 [Thiospirochaeta perfilievii]
MEILIPIKHSVKIDNTYLLKKEFHLTNAIFKKHVGNPNLIQNTYNEMNTYIQVNGLQPITSGYNISVKDQTHGISVDEMEIDVYIGVNPNKL